MKKIEDEFSHIEDRVKRYALRHPERIREKQRKYLNNAKTRVRRQQGYLNRGRHYEARQGALKQVVRRSFSISLKKLIEMSYEESFDAGVGKAILMSDLELIVKQCNKHLADTSKYKFSL